MTISALASGLGFLPSMDSLGCRAARNDEPASGHCEARRERCGAMPPAQTEIATLRYRRTERTALYLETQEGDVVRLRIKVRDSLAVSSTSDGESSEIAVLSRSSTKISLHVEGNLNADELAAIRSVVEQAAALATDFFEGELPAAFAAATALELDGSQLARVGFKLSVREQATYASLGARPLAPPAPGAEPVPATPAGATPAPAPAPEIAAPDAPAATDAPEIADETTPATDDAAPPPTPPAEELPAAPAAPQPNVASTALSLIAQFLTSLLETLAVTPAEEDAASPSLDLSLRLHIYRATLVELAATQRDAPEATSGVPLAAETLDALGAAQQAPLEIHA